jgi:hypothetical protein
LDIADKLTIERETPLDMIVGLMKNSGKQHEGKQHRKSTVEWAAVNNNTTASEAAAADAANSNRASGGGEGAHAEAGDSNTGVNTSPLLMVAPNFTVDFGGPQIRYPTDYDNQADLRDSAVPMLAGSKNRMKHGRGFRPPPVTFEEVRASPCVCACVPPLLSYIKHVSFNIKQHDQTMPPYGIQRPTFTPHLAHTSAHTRALRHPFPPPNPLYTCVFCSLNFRPLGCQRRGALGQLSPAKDQGHTCKPADKAWGGSVFVEQESAVEPALL